MPKRLQDDGEQQVAILTEEEQVIQSTKPIIDFAPAAEIQEKRANVVLKLVDEHRKGGAYLDGEDFVFDPNFDNGEGKPKGKQRKIRLLRGVNTIFVDEQKDISKEDINQNKLSLEFHKLGRQCTLQPFDKTAIQFAEMCNSNIDNPYRFGVKPIYFTIWNPLAEEQKAQKETDMMLDAVQLAATMPFDKMKRHCVFLKISLTDDLGEKLQEGRLRRNYVAYANKNAPAFLKSAENPSVDMVFAIKQLISSGEIDLDKQEGEAFYHNGGYITTIPNGENAADYLVKYSMTDGEPNRAFNAMVKKLAKL